jgi:hypothetical protein
MSNVRPHARDYRELRMPLKSMQFLVPFPEYSVVRVDIADSDSREYTGSEGVMRPPRQNDVGTIVHVHEVKNGEPAYIVESVTSEGYTLWLADFLHSELIAESLPADSSR